MINFNKEELDIMSKEGLQRIAKYLQMPYNSKTTKDELVEMLFGKYGKKPEIPMSARIKRIHNPMEEE